MRGFIRIHYIIQLKCNLYAHCPLPSSGHPNITNFPHFAFSLITINTTNCWHSWPFKRPSTLLILDIWPQNTKIPLYCDELPEMSALDYSLIWSSLERWDTVRGGHWENTRTGEIAIFKSHDSLSFYFCYLSVHVHLIKSWWECRLMLTQASHTLRRRKQSLQNGILTLLLLT